MDPFHGFRKNLIEWYLREGRDLPWRSHGGDPYRVVVSEMMLVQTTVTAVIPFYERFLSRFPTVSELAEADETEVLKLWEGLGYYRRAKQLHNLAKTVQENHQGRFPQTEPELLALPGVGRYIAGAVRSFAFNQPAPILEANTIRVLSRLMALTEPVELSGSQKLLWQEAENRVDPCDPSSFNQAMMDLGAMICTPTSPSCLLCPVQDSCQSFATGLVDQIPVRKPKKPPKLGTELSVIVLRKSDSAVLMMKRKSGGLWSDFWEVPTFWLSGGDPACRSESGFELEDPGKLSEQMKNLMHAPVIKIGLNPKPKKLSYTVTTYKIEAQTEIVELDEQLIDQVTCPDGWTDFGFFNETGILNLTVSSPQRRLLGEFFRLMRNSDV